MGYMVHHSLIVSSWNFDLITEAHERAIAIYSAAKDPLLGETYEGLVSAVTPPAMNGEMSFFIAPDGSKEGWPESALSDRARSEFITFLRSKVYEDGSTSLKWVEVQFADENDDNRILQCSGDQIDKDSVVDYG